MKKIFKFVFGFLILSVLWQASVFAEPQLPCIEKWTDGVACDFKDKAITDCIAYDYLSDNQDKFVKLDATGKETARASNPESLTADEAKETGTVEVSATVPDGIDNAVELVLWDDNGQEYTVTAYKDNNYKAILNIPAGTYSIFSAGLINDFKGEYPAECDKDEVVIEPSAATKIEVTVSGKQDLTDPNTYIRKSGKSEASTPAETPEPTDEPNSSSFTAETKSLLKSTVITILVLALLFICYRVIVWYRSRKNNKEDGE